MSDIHPYKEISENVLSAMNLALEQGDEHMSEALGRALQFSLVRINAGNHPEDKQGLIAETKQALEKFELLRGC